MADNTYVPISDLTNEHLQRALFYTENKLTKLITQKMELEHTISIFNHKRKEIILDSYERGMNIETLLDSEQPKYAPLKEMKLV